MDFNYCLNCMKETETSPCPHCGYDPKATPIPEYALRPGTILHGRYVVGTILGQGGFGITYIAWDLVLQSKVAIKEYFPSGHAGRNAVSGAVSWYCTPQAKEAQSSGMELCLKEAGKMTRLQDIPGVARVTDVFQQNATAYIVMEYISGKTLKAYVEKMGPMTWSQARRIFLPTIDALAQVHRSGVIHRDISPDNLMLLPNSTVKILDLGAAKDTNVNSGTSSVRVAKGGFSPLEQYVQRGGSGPWTDVYAMAATIYYSLTKVVPPTAVDRLDRDHIRWDLPQLKALPPQVLAALQKAMVLQPQKRTQTMEDFADDLEHTPSISPRVQSLIAGILAVVAGILLIVTAWQVKSYTSSQKKQHQPSVSVSAPQNTPSFPRETIPQSPGTVPVETVPQTTALPEATVPSSAPSESALPQQHQTFSAGRRHTVAVQEGGTVIAQGYAGNGQCDVQDWRNIVSVSAGGLHTVGLRSDGTAIAVGYNDDGQCNVGNWSGLISVSAGHHHTVGLRSDGTVVAAGANTYGQCDVSGWTDIVAISAGWDHTVGLKSDGTVVATGQKIKVGNWTNMIAISSGYNFTIGLKSDGTVLSSGNNDKGQCDVSGWNDIVAIAAGYAYSVGLKSDGTVVSVGDGCDKSELRDTRSLRDVSAIAAGSHHIVCMKKDGSFVSVGDNSHNQRNITDWKSIRKPDDFYAP